MYTKQQQLKKIKEPKISQHEKDYLNWLQNQNSTCFVCGTNRLIEWHHVKNKSTDKKRHTVLIPLCIEHHKGNKLSPHGTPKLWRDTYDMQWQEEYAKNIYQEFLDEQI